MRHLFLCFLGLTLTIGFCHLGTTHGDDAPEKADIVFLGGKAYTQDPAQPWADAVAIKGDRITYVGTDEGARARIGRETRVIDCTDKLIMPGFVSSHDHLIASAWTNDGVKLFDAKDKADCLARIKAYAEANPDDKVVKGIGWTKSMLGGHPTAKDLDEAVPGQPARVAVRIIDEDNPMRLEAVGEVITAGFEFDVPVRFDTDQIQVSVASFQAGEVPDVPVVEVRL